MADEVEAGVERAAAVREGGRRGSRAWILRTPTAWAADGTPAGATTGASPATGRRPGSRSGRGRIPPRPVTPPACTAAASRSPSSTLGPGRKDRAMTAETTSGYVE